MERWLHAVGACPYHRQTHCTRNAKEAAGILFKIHLSISGTPLRMKTSACAVAVLRTPFCRTGRWNLFRSGLERNKSAVRLGFGVAVLRRPLSRPSATLSPLCGERAGRGARGIWLDRRSRRTLLSADQRSASTHVCGYGSMAPRRQYL